MQKIKITSTLIVAFFFLTLKAQFMWQIKSDTVVKWYYYDGDEFNGTSYDAEKWTPAFSWSDINYDQKYLMHPKCLVLEDGVCKFMCYRDTGLYTVPSWQFDSAFAKKYASSLVDKNKYRYYFTSGNLWSKLKYNRGYFEIRFKSNDVRGMCPGFWLYGKDKDEIDFFELKGERSKDIHVDVHCEKGCDNGYKAASLFPKSFGGWVKTTHSLKETYNVLAGEWNNGYIKWYLNGEGIAFFKGELGSETMALILGTGPVQEGTGLAPGVNATSIFPNSLDVDYVRVWYLTDKPKNEVLGTRYQDFDYKKTDEDKKTFLKRKPGYMYSSKLFKGDLQTISVLPKNGKKIMIISQGKQTGYQVFFYDEFGKELANETISDTYKEFDFSTLTNSKLIKVSLKVSGKVLEETITLH